MPIVMNERKDIQFKGCVACTAHKPKKSIINYEIQNGKGRRRAYLTCAVCCRLLLQESLRKSELGVKLYEIDRRPGKEQYHNREEARKVGEVFVIQRSQCRLYLAHK